MGWYIQHFLQFDETAEMMKINISTRISLIYLRCILYICVVVASLHSVYFFVFGDLLTTFESRWKFPCNEGRFSGTFTYEYCLQGVEMVRFLASVVWVYATCIVVLVMGLVSQLQLAIGSVLVEEKGIFLKLLNSQIDNFKIFSYVGGVMVTGLAGLYTTVLMERYGPEEWGLERDEWFALVCGGSIVLFVAAWALFYAIYVLFMRALVKSVKLNSDLSSVISTIDIQIQEAVVAISVKEWGEQGYVEAV